MGKDNNIYIRVELSRDKNKGALNLVTHFELDAPNVLNHSEGYFWFPTEGEKDLISETFELMPSDAKSKPSLETIEIKSSPKPEARPGPDLNTTVEVISPNHEPEKTLQPEPPKEFTLTPQPEPPKEEITQTQQPIPEPEKTLQPEPPKEEITQTQSIPDESTQEKKENLPPLEPDEEIKSGYEVAEQKIEEELQKRNQPQPEEKPKDENQEDKKNKEAEEDNGMIVKADSEAIEEALRKHSQEKDESMVDVDEKTIIDKVLKQKKKWNKK